MDPQHLLRSSFVLTLFSLWSSCLVHAQNDLEPVDGNPSFWALSVSLNNYIFADDYIFNPIATADHGWLHVEGRYNYEDLHTLSLFGGYNVHVGDKVAVALTPMIGFAVGHRTAIIPAAEVSLAWGPFEWYTESEVFLDVHDADDDYFYVWSELNYFPIDWLSVGLLATRTRLFGNDLDIQRGLSVGFYTGPISLFGSFMNFGFGDAYVYLAAGYTFEWKRRRAGKE